MEQITEGLIAFLSWSPEVRAACIQTIEWPAEIQHVCIAAHAVLENDSNSAEQK